MTSETQSDWLIVVRLKFHKCSVMKFGKSNYPIVKDNWKQSQERSTLKGIFDEVGYGLHDSDL